MAQVRGVGNASFTWDLTIPTTGTYEVKVRYPQVTGAATNAQFTVNHAAGSTTKTVNQTTGAGTWVSLGSYSFDEGVGKSVKLTDYSNGTVVADAVMLVRNDSAVPRERKDLTYTYDVNANLTAVDDTAAGATDYTVSYDELNRPTRVAGGSTTDYTYDALSQPDTVTIDQVAPLKDQFYDYTWDTRGLLGSVKTGSSATDPAAKTTSYSYDNRGLRTTETKGNSNKVTFSWFDNGLMASSREVKPDGSSLVAEHLLGYDLDGNRTSDAAKVLNSDTKVLDSSSATYAYEPRGRVTAVTRTGAGAVNEAYTYTATSNISAQTVGGVSTSFVYDRNRLLKATTSGVSSYYNHDPFGRLDTITSGGAVVGRYVYDGFDRVTEQRNVTGGVTKTTKSTYDAWDRVATKTDAAGKTTAMSYLGLTSQVLAELDKATNKPTDEFTFDAYGQRLTQTTTKTDGSTEDAWYGYNPHTDVETLTTSTGDTKATYGYTAYGKDRTGAMTGADKPGTSTEPYNLYRYNAKRWDATTGDYDMGFRTYNPGLNRFISRDSYNGALADLNLGVDPWNTNRYAFAGGNPITGIELDGHCVPNEKTNRCISETQDPPAIDVAAEPADLKIGHNTVHIDNWHAYEEAWRNTEAQVTRDKIQLPTTDCVQAIQYRCMGSQWLDLGYFTERLCKQPGIHCGSIESGEQAALAAAAAAGLLFGAQEGRGGAGAAQGGSGATSALSGAQLNRHLAQLEKYGSGGFKELENGRIRYYGDLTPAAKPGEMVGRRLVREWDPATDATRTWHETLDQSGNIRIVRPETGGPKVHYYFDEFGNFGGSW